MDIKFFIVLLCSFNLTLGRGVENKIKKLRGDLGEESDEDEDVVRIQWEGNGNFGKKFSVLSDIDSAESGIPWPILQPPFYYYSSSINDFDRENLSREDQKRLEENSGERNKSNTVKKLRIYEITGPGRRDEKFGENLGNIQRKDSGKIDQESWKNFKKTESGNYGEERNFGKNRSIGNLGEFDNNDNVRKLNEYFERKDNFERWKFGEGNFGKGNRRNFGNQSESNSDNFGNGRNLKVLKVGENFEHRNYGNDKNLKVFNANENFEHLLKVDQNSDNDKNFKILNNDKNFENDKNKKFDENLERTNFGIGRNLKVLKIDEKEMQNNGNFGNKNLKVVKIGENILPVHIRNFGNTEDIIKAHNVQILSRPRDWFDGIKKSDDRIKNESDFGGVKRPKDFENNREIDDDQNKSEETDGAVKETIWDPSKTDVNIKKLRPMQSLSVIRPLEGSQFPRGNRKYQNSEEVSERRNWEFSRDGHLRRKEFQRVNHFKYLDSHSKYGAIPGIPGRDYPVNTEYNQRATKKFLCPTHTDTHIYIADRSSRCQVFYVCYGSNSGVQMVCPDGTLFNQQLQVCDWWFNVIC
ncbi:homeobox protein 2-like [Cotesia glomerata]|uniref:homeobox protein 2-like n=1 Tax=Cotesia glomerata TaxID=32391 RepID=UPI001D013D36|nr:homeobox protein 2-like [Cotesia glomerata]